MKPNLPNFSAYSSDGEFFEFYRKKHTRFLIFYSYGIGCPLTRKTIPFINQFTENLNSRDAEFYFVDSNTNDTRIKIEEEKSEFKIKSKMLVDENQIISKILKIDRTNEALIIDTNNFSIVWRGPVNERFGYGIDNLTTGEELLKNALDNLLKGKTPKQVTAAGLGCAITYDNPVAVTYHKDIAPIIKEKCFSCHSKQNIPPTNLFTFAELRNWKNMIREVIQTSQMPPWEPDNFYSEFKDTTGYLTSQQKKLILDWLDLDCPEGKYLKLAEIPDPQFKLSGDFFFKNKEPIHIPADSDHPWYYEKISLKNDSDFVFNKILYRPSNPKILQHLAIIVTKNPIDLSKNVFQPQFQDVDNIYNIIRLRPAVRYEFLHDDMVYRIPKGYHAYLEMHFSNSGVDENENIKFLFTKYSGRKKYRELLLHELNPNQIQIPPNTPSYKISAIWNPGKKISIYNLGAHMHLRGKSAKVFLLNKEGQQKLIFSQRYLFKNRRTYLFKKPVEVPAGTQIQSEFEYDNSISNPARIDYQQSVPYGEDAFKNEMATMHIMYTEGGSN